MWSRGMAKHGGEPIGELLDKARVLDKRALGKLVSVLEDERAGGALDRLEITKALGDQPAAAIVGVTGAPGVGKSTLVAELCRRHLHDDSDRTVAVVAVDPSSELSRGAVLGDRTRLSLPAGEPRLFFRSQANELELGGLSPRTFQVTRVLRRLFDLVIVETVGVGQAEVDICHLADLSLLLVGPESGDQVQFMKAGLIELPDLIVATKCDLPGSKATAARLRAGLGERTIVEVSAVKGLGMDELESRVFQARNPGPEAQQAADDYFVRAWIRRQFGETGLAALSAGFAVDGGYDAQVAAFAEHYRRWLCPDEPK